MLEATNKIRTGKGRSVIVIETPTSIYSDDQDETSSELTTVDNNINIVPSNDTQRAIIFLMKQDFKKYVDLV